MNPIRAPRLALLLGAFCLTLSLLALRDRLDAPRPLEVGAPQTIVVLAGS